MTIPVRTRFLALAACTTISVVLARVVVRDGDEATPVVPPLGAHEAHCADLAAPERRASACELRASSQMARFAFRPEQGLSALQALGEAADCHVRAGNATAAARVQHERTAWRSRVERDYRDQRLRLAHALRHEDPIATRRAAEHLLALLGDRDEAYTLRLRALAARAEPVAEGPR